MPHHRPYNHGCVNHSQSADNFSCRTFFSTSFRISFTRILLHFDKAHIHWGNMSSILAHCVNVFTIFIHFFLHRVIFSLPSHAYIFYWLRAKFHAVSKTRWILFLQNTSPFVPWQKEHIFYLVNIHLAIMKYTRTFVYISYFSVACSAARKYGFHIDLFKKNCG